MCVAQSFWDTFYIVTGFGLGLLVVILVAGFIHEFFGFVSKRKGG